MQNAEADARARVAELQQSIRDEQARLTAAQQSTAAYVRKLKELYQHEMEFLGGLSKLSAAATAAPADPVGDTARDIEENVERIIQQEEQVPQPASVTPITPMPEPAKKSGESSLYDELMELSGRKAQASHHPAEDEDDEVEEPTRRIDFDNLQFGKDYEIR